MSLNIELLTATLDDIRKRPQGWNQDHWFSCFAFRACMVDGGVLVDGSYLRLSAEDPDDVIEFPLSDSPVVHVRYRARRILGLNAIDDNLLFCGTPTDINRLEENIQRVIAMHKANS